MENCTANSIHSHFAGNCPVPWLCKCRITASESFAKYISGSPLGCDTHLFRSFPTLSTQLPHSAIARPRKKIASEKSARLRQNFLPSRWSDGAVRNFPRDRCCGKEKCDHQGSHLISHQRRKVFVFFYCKASINRVIVRFRSLSERRSSSIL